MSKNNILNDIKSMNVIHTTWKDYALLLLNSTPDLLRGIWRTKIVSDIIHAEFSYNSIFESHLIGLNILSQLPNEFTEMVVDDHFKKDSWECQRRLNGSRRMKVRLGHYPQDSVDNETLMCLQYIVKHWDEYSHLIFQNDYLKAMWDFAQKFRGQVVYPDEILTYNLEKEINNERIYWIDVSEDVFINGPPSNKYDKYWYSKKLDGFPFDDSLLDLEDKKKNFLSVANKLLKEDILSCPSWKRVCICILKNDVSMRYLGCAPSLKEKRARETAIAAFNKYYK